MNVVGVSHLLAWPVITLICLSTFASPPLTADPLVAVFTLDTAPGTEQAIGLLSPRVLEHGDHAGVVVVGTNEPRVLLRPSEDRDALASALQRAGVRFGAGLGPVRVNDNQTANIGSAIKLACQQLQQKDFDGSKRVIILLFGTPDPSLPSQTQSLKAAIGAADARLYVVAVDRSIEQRRSPSGSSPRHPLGLPSWSTRVPELQTTTLPSATAQILEQLAEDSGGRMYRRNWDLKEILREARR
jgi:hypothetical protein